MYKIGKYKGSDTMSELICEDYQMLLVMSRFGIALGFGEQTIEEVCLDNNVDTKTFLAVVNLLIDQEEPFTVDTSNLSLISIVEYLRNSHTYFLDFKLPSIRQKLVEAMDRGNNDIALVIIKYYDEYVAEVRKHMMYEEETVFPYVESLLNGSLQKKYNIDIFSRQHDKVESKLSELKNIIIKYYPAKSSNDMNSVLFDIFSCSRDLASHNEVEDKLFVPIIRNLEFHQNQK